MLTKAFIPYNGYYSSPFCRWQGSMANENAMVWGSRAKLDVEKELRPHDSGLHVLWDHHCPASHVFSHVWAAAMLVDNAKPLLP